MGDREGPMTKSELITSLRMHRKIDFEESTLTAPSQPVADAIGQTIETVIPDQATVVYGIQSNVLTFGEDSQKQHRWSGKHEWYLITSPALVYVAANAERKGQSETVTTEAWSVSLEDLSSIRMQMTFDEMIKDTIELYLHSASIVLAFRGLDKPIDVSSGILRGYGKPADEKAVERFVRELVNAGAQFT
jgi:hypothetical protein